MHTPPLLPIIAQKRLVCKPNVAPYGRTLANKVVFWCFSPYFGIYNDKMEFFSALARKKAWHRALLGLRFTNFVRELTHSVCKRIYKYKINIKKLFRKFMRKHSKTEPRATSKRNQNYSKIIQKYNFNAKRM